MASGLELLISLLMIQSNRDEPYGQQEFFAPVSGLTYDDTREETNESGSSEARSRFRSLSL